MTRRPPSRRDSAFTLVEVMVALAIIAVALLTLIVIRNNSVKEAQQAREVTLVARLAQQKMGQLEVEPFEERADQGSFEEYPEIQWKKEVALEVLETSAAPSSSEKPLEIYKITLTLLYPKDSGEEGILTIISYRLKPEDEQPQEQGQASGGGAGSGNKGASGSQPKSGGS